MLFFFYYLPSFSYSKDDFSFWQFWNWLSKLLGCWSDILEVCAWACCVHIFPVKVAVFDMVRNIWQFIKKQSKWSFRKMTFWVNLQLRREKMSNQKHSVLEASIYSAPTYYPLCIMRVGNTRRVRWLPVRIFWSSCDIIRTHTMVQRDVKNLMKYLIEARIDENFKIKSMLS